MKEASLSAHEEMGWPWKRGEGPGREGKAQEEMGRPRKRWEGPGKERGRPLDKGGRPMEEGERPLAEGEGPWTIPPAY